VEIPSSRTIHFYDWIPELSLSTIFFIEHWWSASDRQADWRLAYGNEETL
jgi:hypothetical protein